VEGRKSGKDPSSSNGERRRVAFGEYINPCFSDRKSFKVLNHFEYLS